MIILVMFLAFLTLYFVSTRIIILHPFKTSFYSLKDVCLFLYYRKWNECRYGFINAYTGLFGKGKTLSAVRCCTRTYNKYNDKRVYCKRRKCFVTQKIHIISNVVLSIPYERFESLSQLVKVADTIQNIDDLNNTLTVTIAFADELSVQMNSRNFKTNIDALFLNTLLTCRHYRMGLIYTAQRFGQVDALLRQVTSVVIECSKLWRLQYLSFYDAWEIENATTPAMLKPLARRGWFVRDKDYAAYDTFATVGNLSKSCLEKDMLSSGEILALQCNTGANMDVIVNPSKKYKKFLKKYK